MGLNSLDIHLIGICGTGMGTLAGLLQSLGHRVRGSDAQVYPPMCTALGRWGIAVMDGYAESHLQPHPDLVVVGNVVREGNPEASYARAVGLQTLSMPEAVARFAIADKHSLVIAGTHGKTTTTALAAHVLTHGGYDPSFFIGGVLQGQGAGFRVGAGAHAVVEGDEYDAAYFDKAPKFVHYRAKTAVITSLELDHVDIFASISEVTAAFARLLETLPSDGHLVVWDGAERARRLLGSLSPGCDVTIYATEPRPDAQLSLRDCRSGPAGISFAATYRGQDLKPMRVPLWGDQGAANAAAVIAALLPLGVSEEHLRQGLATFPGVKRRMEVLAEPRGIAVVDDFAHHPTAVAGVLHAARSRWPGRRLWALFEPRSASTRRNVFQDALVSAFATADRVVISGHERLAEISPGQRFDPERLVTQLRAQGVAARYEADAGAIVEMVGREATAGDVVLIMSNGTFAGIHHRLIQRLEDA